MWARLKAVLLVLLLLMLVSGAGFQCGGASRKLVGTWSGSTGCGAVNMTFHKDGTGTAAGPMGSESFRWRVEGEELVITFESGTSERVRFQLQGNALTLQSPDGAVTLYRATP